VHPANIALDRYHNDILGSVLTAYRQSIGLLQSARIGRIEYACEVLQTQPSRPSFLDTLHKALLEWASLCGPLITFNVHHGFENQILKFRNLVRALIAILPLTNNTTSRSRSRLSARGAKLNAGTADQLEQDRVLIERESLDARMKRWRIS